MEKTYFIYVLVNPIKSEIFYVGTTSHPVTTRDNFSIQKVLKGLFYKTHLKINYIKEMGCDPVLLVIDKIECKHIAYKWGMPKRVLNAEKYWIEKFLDLGMDLQNIHWLKEEPAFQAAS